MRKMIPLLTILLTLVVLFSQKSYSQITVSGAITGNGSYTTLGSAISTIGTSQSGANIVITVTASTTETATVTIGAGNWASMLIYPTVTGNTISGSVAGALIQLSGANNVTINGSVNQGNSAKDLTIVNSNTAGQAIVLINDAVSNTIKYCNIKGSNSTVTSGVIVFSTAASSGNNSNTIDNCNITANGSNFPVNLVYSLGTSAKNNSNNTISNSNLYDFHGSYSAAIKDSANTTNWTISNNSIYENATYTYVAGTTYAIYINNTSGNGFIVTGNYIGGNSALCSGTWTTVSSAVNNRFIGIYLNVGTTTASSLQNNTIQNINWFSSGTNAAVPGTWCGIYLVAGNANIGNVTGNTIGQGTGTGSITITNSTANTYSFGIENASPNTVNISNNTLGSITAAGAVAGNTHSIYIIHNSNAAATTNIVINNNLLGSLTTANSINLPTLGSGTPVKQFINGIVNSATGTIAITNNTLANFNNNQDIIPNAATNPMIFGIYTSGGTNTITGNTVRNLSVRITSVSGGVGLNSSIIGITMNATALGGQTISNNNIYSLYNNYTGTTSLISITGMYYNGATTGTNIVSKNFIHSLGMASTLSTSTINGIYINAGTVTYQNNMIQLGINADGSAITTGYALNGIYEAAGTDNFYFNSIYIGGSGVTGTTSSTYAFNSLVTTNTRVNKDNIFVNNRSGGTTGKHYVIAVAGTSANPAGLTINYNDYFAGTGAVLGYFNSADRTSLSAWQTAVGQDANSISIDPQFKTPNGTSTTTDLHIATTSVAAGTPISGITTDFDGDTRSITTPCIGADELSLCTTPANQPTVLNLTPTATTVTISFTASTGGADHYLIVRNTTSTIPSTPTNGTIYSSIIPLTGSTFVAFQTGTSFTDTSLTSNTQYYYFIYAANSNCAGGPLYAVGTPLSGTASTLCGTPVAQPTALSLTPGLNNIAGSFTASATADHYLIFRSTSATAPSPINLTNYSIGTVLGSDTVIAYQSGFTFNDAGLNSGVMYYYFVFAANSSCTGGPIYLSTSPLTYNIATLNNSICVAPNNAPTNLILTPGSTTISGSFTASIGGADYYLILRNSTGITPIAPVNTTLYTAGTAYDASGDVVIAYQLGLSFTDVNLQTGTHYFYYIYAANSICTGGPAYSLQSLNAVVFTNCATPSAQPTFTGSVISGLNTISFTFTPPTTAPDNYLIVRSTLSATPTAPVNLTNYTPGTSVLSTGDSVIAFQTGTTVNDINLTQSSKYYYWIYSVNSICSVGPKYLTTAPLAIVAYTTCVYPANQPTNISLTSTTSTVTGSFTASAGSQAADHYLIVRNTTGITPSIPVDGTPYTGGISILSPGDSVIAYQTTTTISDTRLLATTKYYYFIYAVNSTCNGGPLYLTASPLTANIITTGVYATPGTYTWVCPANVTSVNVFLWGGGGGGGGGTPGSYFGNGGGGGGGACAVNNYLTVVPGNSYTVTVGAGGTAGTSTTNGGTGGASILTGNGLTLNAAGGNGGAFSPGTSSASFAGGAGGSTGTGTVYSGGNGSSGYDGTSQTTAISGTGGGAGGSGGNGTTPANTCSVTGTGGNGTYPGGNGGYNSKCGTSGSTSNDLAGVAGAVPGGGGSGDYNYDSFSGLAGGAGGAGQVIISVNQQCATPVAQPTTLSLTPSSNAVTGSFTASATADHYLIIRNTSGTLNATPIDTKTYSTGDTLGSGLGIVAAYQTSTSISNNGLNGNTHYYYYIFAANSSCAGGPLYLSSSPLTGNTITLCSTPLAQPTILSLTPDTNKVTLSFTPSTSADHYLICRSTSGTFSSTIPNGFGFSNGTTFGVDTVISYQTGTSLIDANLHPNTQYYYFVFAANSSCTGGPMYLSTSPLTNNVVTLINIPCTAPTNPPTSLSLTPGLTTITGSYTASTSADHYLIIRNNTGISPTVPANGTLYTSGTAFDNFGDSIVAYQIGLSFTDSRLNTSSHYYYFIYAANSTCIGGPLYYSTSLNGNVYTNCAAPLLQPSNLTFAPGVNTISGSFTASATADHYLIVRSTLSATPTAPVNAMNYNPGTATLSTGDSVIAYQTSTTFTDVNLSSSTHYYYWVYAANSNCSGTYPMYLATTPLAANTYTNCISPGAQPTILSLTPLATTLTGSFTASASADHYLIVRSTLNTLSTLPANGTTYNANDLLGGGTVVAYQATTTISDLNLGASTQYYYYIFAANSNCSGGPLYLITSPLIGSITTFPTALNGIYTINSGQATGGTNFISFADAVNTLNTLGISGSVTFNVFAGQSWSATCTTTNPYGFKITTTGTATNPITFQKFGTGANPVLNITGTSTTGEAGIWLNSISYINFDGIDISDPGYYLDYGYYLVGSATNGCNYNTIKNCNITLSNTSSNLNPIGIYVLSTATSSTGRNTYNKFYNNIINKAFYGVKFTGMSSYYDVRNEIGTQNNGSSVIKNIGYAGAVTAQGINIQYQDSVQIFNTLIDSLRSTSGTTGSLVGIHLANPCSNLHFYGDTIKDVIGSENYGINFGTSAINTGINSINNCVLRDFIETTGNTNLIRIAAAQSTLYFYNNQEFNISTTSTGAYGIEGFYTNSAGTYYLYNNNIYNFNSVGTTVVDAIAINTTVATTAYIYNNFISDLNNPAGTTVPAVNGIKLGSLSTAYVYYNTVYLKYAASAAANSSACLFATATPTLLDLRNNIFINKCDMTSGTRAAAFWWNSTAYTNIAATTNNNIYYAGTPSSKNLIFYDGTNSVQTLAAYQTLVSPRDAVAFTEDVPFINTSTKPYDLHVNPITVTNVESHGQRITTPIAIATDIDGDLRWGETGYTGTGTATDIGADEYNHILPCAAPTSQAVSLSLTPAVTTINGSFTASASADHYLIVRNTTGINPAAALVNGTIYSSSNQLTGSTFVAYQTSTTFNDIGLLGNTIYYYYIYAANAINCTNGPAYLATNPLTANVTTNCATPISQPTAILLAPGSTTINGSFTASDADHYLIVRSTTSNLGVTPLNGSTYNANDIFGNGTILAYQTGTTISDAGLTWNTTYYYFVFAANSTCTGGPAYLSTLPLTGSATTLPPPVTNKTLNITAMLQEYYNGAGAMNQTQGIDWNSGNLFNNFGGTIVDTLSVLIRETNVTDPNNPCTIDTALYGQNLNVDGTISPIIIPASITGFHYIVIKHRNSIETWSDSVDFTNNTISYNFNTHISQFAMDGGMYIDGSNLAYIWGGDVNQNGNLESEDATQIYVAAISDDETVNNGYVINDIDGNGNIDSQDYGLAYSNSIIGANIINPFSYQKKK